MSDTTKKQLDHRELRQARLEEALRENLKKRKALARKRSSSQTSGGNAGHDGNSKNSPED